MPSPNRRDLLRYGLSAAAASLALPAFGRRLFAEEPAPAAPLVGAGRAKQLVLLYMIGGPSQFETLDPKPGATTGGPTRTVASAIPGVALADSLPGLAKRMDRVTLIRSMTSREGNHDRARYLVHTGFAPNPTLTHPSIGAILSHARARTDAELPDYVSIGGPGAGSGYLGVAHAPFVVQDPRRPIANLEVPAGLAEKRVDARLDLLEKVNERFARERGADIPDAQRVMFEKSRRLMESKQVAAFDLSQEKEATARPYGSGAFGLGCLMARRLVEAGVSCVEVMMGGWDTHDDNFERTKALNLEMDQGVSALLDDLRSSGRLDSTLVAWVGDFGRTPDITGTQGRGHYPQAWSAFLAGGGVPAGRVIGATDALGRRVAEAPVTIPDLFATFAHALGFDGSQEFQVNGRPITLVDKSGRPI
jgi:hypothetical protein